MAAVTITTSAVQQISSGEGMFVQYGEAMTPGAIAYKGAGGKYFLASNDDATEQDASVFVLTGGETDSYGYVQGRKNEEVDVGGTLVVGTMYFLGTGGQIVVAGDLGTGAYVTPLGVAKTTTNLRLNIDPTGIQVP